ncbi:MAG: hypothetical protein HQK77_11565 [Desulfobacterales bacterium]|nr:hypothetical protein [Desulfobacterales bacterium]
MVFQSAFPLQLPPNKIQKLPAVFDARQVGVNNVEIFGHCLVRNHLSENQFDFKLSIQTTGAMTNEFDDDFEI